jgi:2-methylcitrate dehydratase PrpD
VLPHVGISDAIGLQTAVIRHTEIDDIHTRSCVTPSSVTVPTALSLARNRGEIDPDAVASAIWVGTELMTRLGVAINGPKILYRGVWPTYFTAPLGAAAIACRIGKLSEDQTTHALSLALMLTAGRSGRFHGKLPGRSIILAMAVANGVRAADAARQGVSGDPELLHSTWLKDAHGLESDLGAMTSGLGGNSIYPQMTLKPFCSAKQAISSIEALMALIDEGLAPETISKVSVRVPPPYAGMIAMKPGLDSRSSTIVSAAFQMGLAAHNRARLYDIERAEALLEHDAMAFADKVEIAADESLLESFPASYPAEIDVTAGGKMLRRRVTAAYGDPARPLDDAALHLKAERVWSTPLMQGRSRAKTVVTLGLAGLQDRDSCKRLADAMWVVCAT